MPHTRDQSPAELFRSVVEGAGFIAGADVADGLTREQLIDVLTEFLRQMRAARV